MPPPERAKPARKSARSGVGDGSPCTNPPHTQPVGSGPRLHARKVEWLGVGGRPTPDAPHLGKRRPPRATSCRPHSAQSQLARARAVGLLTGPHACIPRTHSHRVVGLSRTPEKTSGRGWESAQPRTPHTQARGAPPRHLNAAPTASKASSQVASGPRPHARDNEWSGMRERPTPGAPHPGKRPPPRAPSCRPHSASSQSARPARKSAHGGVADGFSRPHPPYGERAARSQVMRNRTGPPPPQASQTEHGTEAGHAEGHGPSGTALPAPSTRTARGARATPTQGGGGGGTDVARARAHTHTKDTRGKPEGQPHGMAYLRARIRDTQTGRPATHRAGNAGRAGGNREDTTPGTGPNPPEPAASAACTRPGHCTCQRSSGA